MVKVHIDAVVAALMFEKVEPATQMIHQPLQMSDGGCCAAQMKLLDPLFPAQMATGEVDFLRGQMLENLNRHKEARDALKQAIAKGGLKRIGAAYLTLGNAELALNDKAAARAAYQKAEQDPETRANAQRTLKQMGHK